ncbi:MAG TPA: phosphate ABC transporter permease PstA [Candidatus Altiarchaeales archaeon]|nr:phosphate ABC transporter permease PstA [Candidatus Altiarchaeales archaeon]HEX54599.1 phosphate ABC transporter permease PstA [Candidatus Altiarchaeales archaeon]
MFTINPRVMDKIVKLILWISALLIILILFSIIFYIFLRGWNVMSIEFIFGWPREDWEQGGIFPAIFGTFYMVFISLIFAMPIGVGASVFLVEFTRNEKLINMISTLVDSLNAIPSIVFGLLGLALFVSYLKMAPSVLAAGLILGFMILPTVMRTSEVAIRSVPISEKEGSYALGATRLQTIRFVVLPRALPGIVTGAILALGRAIGETAPIIFLVIMTPAMIPISPLDPNNALTYVLYMLAAEQTPRRIEVAFGISLVLISIVLFLNYTARFINNYLSRNINR